MIRRTPLKRFTPVRKKRPGPPRRGQPTNEEKEAIRVAARERAGGLCQLHLIPECISGVLPLTGPDHFSHGHLVHIHAKRRFGWGMDNVLWGCWKCHEASHNCGGRPLSTNTTNSEVR